MGHAGGAGAGRPAQARNDHRVDSRGPVRWAARAGRHGTRARRGPGIRRAGALPGHGRRLRLVSYQGGRQAVRGRAGHPHALRGDLFHQHHAGRTDQHRPVVGAGLLQRPAQRDPSRRQAPLPGIPVSVDDQREPRGRAGDHVLPRPRGPGAAAKQGDRPALATERARNRGRLERTVFSRGPAEALSAQIAALEPRRLPCRRPGPLRRLPHGRQRSGCSQGGRATHGRRLRRALVRPRSERRSARRSGHVVAGRHRRVPEDRLQRQGGGVWAHGRGRQELDPASQRRRSPGDRGLPEGHSGRQGSGRDRGDSVRQPGLRSR